MLRVARALLACSLLAAPVLGQAPAGPLVQEAYIKGTLIDSVSGFGRSLSAWEDTLLVGAPGQSLPSLEGAAYVYERGPTGWVEQALLLPPVATPSGNFGMSVGLWGDTAVVGSPDAKVGGVKTGAVFVYVRDAGGWTLQATLTSSNPEHDDLFGWSVAISGDTIAVGAWGEDSPSTGINGAQGNGEAGAGAAYVFVRSGTAWTQQAYIKASNTDGGDKFGQNVALQGDTLVVAAPWEQSGAAGIDGNQADNSLHAAGSVYVYVRSGGVWTQQAYVKASNTGDSDYFGDSVALDGDTLVVDASGEAGGSTGVNGNQADNSQSSSGALYVFVRNGAIWTQQAYIKASNAQHQDLFGFRVAVAGDLLLAGAVGEGSKACGVDADQSSNAAPFAGAVYVFRRTAGVWAQEHYVKPSWSSNSSWFGAAIAISDSWCAIGAYLESGTAHGINGDPTVLSLFPGPGSMLHSGAVYAFDLEPSPWTDLTFALPGAAGPPYLAGFGELTPGSPTALNLVNGAPSAPAFMFVGLSPLFVFFKQGVCVPRPDFIAPRVTDAQGKLDQGFFWPPGIPAGTIFYVQDWITDASAPAGFSASNGVVAVAH